MPQAASSNPDSLIHVKAEFADILDVYQRWERHPLSAIWPDLADYEQTALRESIRMHGQKVPIVVTVHGENGNDFVLDGWHRQQALIQLWKEDEQPHPWNRHLVYKVLPKNIDPAEFVVAANRARRQITQGQWAAVMAELEALPIGRPKKVQTGGISTAEQLAELSGVGQRSLERTRAIRDQAPILHQAVKAGILSPADAYNVLDQPADDHETLVNIVHDRRADTAFLAAQRLRKERAALEVEATIDPPQGEYKTIVCDPPWPMDAVPYPTMSLDEITALQLPAADNCILWLWTTQKFLEAACHIVHEWGFEREAIITWCKPGGRQPTGMPQLATEFVLLGYKGEGGIPLKETIGTWFEAERGEHSAKPDKFYETVRTVSPEPRIDMFNRRPIEGFTAWGAEAHE